MGTYQSKLVLALLLIVLLAACGGGEQPCIPQLDDCRPENVPIERFQVIGNAPAVNGREQIVAEINGGVFKIGIGMEPLYSNSAQFFLSDSASLDVSTLEHEIAKFTCGFFPFCAFRFEFSCSFTVENRAVAGVPEAAGPSKNIFP